MRYTRSRSRSPAVAATLILAAVSLVSLSACGEEPRTPVPDELLGTWTTDNERYADRAMQFTETSVLFHTGAGKFELAGFGVVDIQVEERENGRRHYDIGYADETGVTRFEIIYQPVRETVQLVNQPLMIWTRDDPEATPDDAEASAAGQ